MDSLHQVIHGLYPTQKLGPGVTPRLLVRLAKLLAAFYFTVPNQLGLFRNARDENLVGNMLNCKRLEVLLLKFANGSPISNLPFIPYSSFVIRGRLRV